MSVSEHDDDVISFFFDQYGCIHAQANDSVDRANIARPYLAAINEAGATNTSLTKQMGQLAMPLVWAMAGTIDTPHELTPDQISNLLRSMVSAICEERIDNHTKRSLDVIKRAAANASTARKPTS
jgi:hypothetical protein